jgi:MFS-type transporter involved in bile tolerance (Atg22 family)
MGKTSSVLGPWMFGWIVALAGSARPAVLAVGGFFLLGAALLAPLKEP